MAFSVQAPTHGTLNGTTEVTLVPAPGASTIRIIRSIKISNQDSQANKIIVMLGDGATRRTIFVVTLAIGDNLLFDEDDLDVLGTTSQSIIVKMGAAAAATNPDFSSDYGDQT